MERAGDARARARQRDFGLTTASAENVRRLKNLEYLNLAMNKITMIENLEGCESLVKLDLTMNEIAMHGLLNVSTLAVNVHLRELFLMGNPCADAAEDYRSFVIMSVPQLTHLDGSVITPLERIIARQNYTRVVREFEIVAANEDVKQTTIDTTSASDVSVTPDIHHNNHAVVHSNAFDTLPDDFADVKQKNQGDFVFTLTESEDESALELEVRLNTFIDTSLIHVDIQPRVVRVKIKGDLLQLRLSHEVATDASVASRSKSTGKLLITMPKLNWHVKQRLKGSRKTSANPCDPVANVSYCSNDAAAEEPPDVM